MAHALPSNHWVTEVPREIKEGLETEQLNTEHETGGRGGKRILQGGFTGTHGYITKETPKVTSPALHLQEVEEQTNSVMFTTNITLNGIPIGFQCHFSWT